MTQTWPTAFHNLTFIKILRSQGHTQYARELAEQLLTSNPENHEASQVLEELREEARLAFERFRSGGRQAKAVMN